MADERAERIELVRWVDSVCHNGWGPLPAIEAMEDMASETAGFVVAETDAVLALAQSVSRPTERKPLFAEVMCIPKGAIVSRKVLS